MANEKRLIDANALIKHMKDLPTWFEDGGGVWSCLDGYPKGLFYPKDIISSIENAPTVDAVEVVRCKDCKWYDADCEICVYLSEDGDTYDFGCDVNMKPDDFCSYGERKDYDNS